VFEHLAGQVGVFDFRAAPGRYYAPRAVGESVEEIEVVLAGRGRFRMRDGDADAGPGSALWFLPGEAVEVWADAATPYECVVFRFNVSARPAVVLPGLSAWADPVECDRFCRGALALFRSGQSTAEHFAWCHYARLFWEATEFVRRGRRDRMPPALRRAVEFVGTEAATPLSVADIAAHAGVSVPHLFSLFRREFGVAPMKYVNRLRVQRAQELFRTGRDSVKEVCHQVGIPNPRNFCKVFRRINGMSPRQYRQRFAESAGPGSGGRRQGGDPS